MAIFNGYRTAEPETQVIETSRETETVEETSRQPNWPMLIALAVFALAFATLVALASRWAYNHWHKASPANSSQNLPEPPPTDLGG
jgi:hypothetical protein